MEPVRQLSESPVATLAGSAGSSHIEARTWLKALLLFLASLLLYFFTRSPGLDEIDSVNFAMGVRHYNLWLHQPQPPGYPLYIFCGFLGSLIGVNPNTSLHFASTVGGALLVGAWFIIIRLQFNERLANWVALCLSITPVIWMTATKVLTDCLAAGLLSTEVLAAVYFTQTGRKAALLATGLLGAAAAAGRPGLILVVFAVLATALWRGPKVPGKWAILSWVTLIGACLIWLLPMWYMQSTLKPEVAAGAAYPVLVYNFWAPRLHNPTNYLFAGNWSPKYLGIRCAFHFLGWFGVGFGFLQSRYALVIGTIISLAGVVAYWLTRKENADGDFWKFHLPWALVQIAGIFINLPASQRYYVIIFPLLLVLMLRGLLQLRQPWNKIAFVLPAVLLLTSIPVAVANHRDDPPPMRLIQYLQKLYPAEQRSRVVLLLSTRTKRHFEYYAPDFVIVNPIPPPEAISEVTRDAVAVYTDDPWAPLPAGWYRVPLNAFTRSVIIYWKVHYLELYLIDRRQQR